MVQANYEDEQQCAVLIRATSPGLSALRYQGFCPEPLYHDGERYDFAEFGVGSIQKSLSSGHSTDLSVANVSAVEDDFLQIREKYYDPSRDGFRGTLIEFFFIFPDRPDGMPAHLFMEVASSSISGAEISLSLESIPNAVDYMIPSIYACRKILPELPFSFRGAGN